MVIGILSFEVASLISKVIQLWQFLENDNYQEIMNAFAIRSLVSYDDDCMLGLIYSEVMDDFCHATRIVAWLARKCSEPNLKRLEHGLDEHLMMMKDGKHSYKMMEKKVKEMKTLVSTNEQLYHEMHKILDLEETIRTLKEPTMADLIETEKKIEMQQLEVDLFKKVSNLWNSTFDEIVQLLVGFLCTTFHKIELVFGVVHVGDLGIIENSRAHSISSSSGFVIYGESLGQIHHSENNDHHNQLGRRPVKLAKNKTFWCFSATRDDVLQIFSSKNRQQTNAPAGTLGDAGFNLALVYANIIIEIENLVETPLAIRTETVNELKERLPQSIRFAVRKSLKNQKSESGLSTSVVEWRSIISEKLDSLTPLAHNTIMKWGYEVNCAHMNLVHWREKVVFRVQTLYFADQGKIDGVITEMIVGLTRVADREPCANSPEESRSSVGMSDQSSELDYLMYSLASKYDD